MLVTLAWIHCRIWIKPLEYCWNFDCFLQYCSLGLLLLLRNLYFNSNWWWHWSLMEPLSLTYCHNCANCLGNPTTCEHRCAYSTVHCPSFYNLWSYFGCTVDHCCYFHHEICHLDIAVFHTTHWVLPRCIDRVCRCLLSCAVPLRPLWCTLATPVTWGFEWWLSLPFCEWGICPHLLWRVQDLCWFWGVRRHFHGLGLSSGVHLPTLHLAGCH